MISDSCSQDEFVQRVQELQAKDPDVAWEALALIDQHARRNQISRELFESLKSPLQLLSMGLKPERKQALPPKVARPQPQTQSEPQRQPPPRLQPAPQPSVPPLPEDPLPAAEKPQRRALQVGDVLRGRYRVVDIISHQGSTLLEAVDELRARVPGAGSRRAVRLWEGRQSAAPEFLQRLYELQSLSHSGIARVFDVEVDSGTALLASEWLVGISLQQLLELNAGARLASPVAQAIVRTVASALAYAHLRDTCHGNVSEGNVFLTETGEIRLRGFVIEPGWHADQRSDRQAFAQLAYRLLSGEQWPRADGRGGHRTRLREPPGLSREQWRLMRATLLGRRERAGDLIAAFAGPGDVAARRVNIARAFARRAVSAQRLNGWIGSAVVAAIAAGALYLVFSKGHAPIPEQASLPVEIPAAPEVPIVIAEAPVVAAPVLKPPAFPVASNQRALVDLQDDILEVQGNQPVARIWVRRGGGLNRPVTFRWWTETGTAKANLDFIPVSPREAEIPSGAHGVALMVPLVSDPSRRMTRTFYVKIDETGSGATLGRRTLMQVRIVPADPDSQPINAGP